MQKREPSLLVSWCSHYGKQYGGSSELKIELQYDPAIPFLGIYLDCTPRFIAALLTIAKTWKQPKCPSTDEWIKKLWCIYTIEY